MTDKKELENLAKNGTLFCKKHQYYLSVEELNYKNCGSNWGKRKQYEK